MRSAHKDQLFFFGCIKWPSNVHITWSQKPETKQQLRTTLAPLIISVWTESEEMVLTLRLVSISKAPRPQIDPGFHMKRTSFSVRCLALNKLFKPKEIKTWHACCEPICSWGLFLPGIFPPWASGGWHPEEKQQNVHTAGGGSADPWMQRRFWNYKQACAGCEHSSDCLFSWLNNAY